MTDSSTPECCPEFDPSRYNEKTNTWSDKLFIKDTVRQVFHIPVNMGTVVTKMFKQIEEAQAMPDKNDFLMLSFDPSPWKSELYMTVTKDVPNAEMTKLSGTYLSKVYDGPYSAVPKWIKDMDSYVATKGKKTLKYYFHYAYCPKCSKKYGHNYVTAFALVN